MSALEIRCEAALSNRSTRIQLTSNDGSTSPSAALGGTIDQCPACADGVLPNSSNAALKPVASLSAGPVPQ